MNMNMNIMLLAIVLVAWFIHHLTVILIVDHLSTMKHLLELSFCIIIVLTTPAHLSGHPTLDKIIKVLLEKKGQFKDFAFISENNVISGGFCDAMSITQSEIIRFNNHSLAATNISEDEKKIKFTIQTKIVWLKGTLSFSNSMAHASVVFNVESFPSLNYDVHLKITDNNIRVLNLDISDLPFTSSLYAGTSNCRDGIVIEKFCPHLNTYMAKKEPYFLSSWVFKWKMFWKASTSLKP